MRFLFILLCSVVWLKLITCPPLDKKKGKEKEKSENDAESHEDSYPEWLDLEYGRYLKEIVQVLEGDDEFRKRLEEADVEDIKRGDIAKNLDLVNHGVRSKLDELKRQEMERLRKLSIKQYETNRGIDRRHLKVPMHINYKNPETFEVEDLKKLILQTTKDLEKADEERKEQFKKYEMEKEFKRQEELKNMDEEHKKKAEKDYAQAKKRHRDHPKMHHPGAKPQLEEVWEKQDHMEEQDFDPLTFFNLHDLNGDGYLDANEIKALFKTELDKTYDPKNPDDDMQEREEEMERMRAHVVNEIDTDRNGLVSWEEFLESTRRAEFQEDEGWEGIDDRDQFSEEEFREYMAQREREIQRIMAKNQQYPHDGPQPGVPNSYGGPQPGVPHPNDIPQGMQHPNAIPQGMQHPNAVPQGMQHPNAIPQGMQHPNAVPQGVQNPNAIPQGMQNPNAVPQQRVQNPNAIPQGMQHPNAIPQGMQNPNAIPHPGMQNPNAIPQPGMHNPNAIPQQRVANANAIPQPGVQNPNAIPQPGVHNPNAIPQQPNAIPQDGRQYSDNVPPPGHFAQQPDSQGIQRPDNQHQGRSQSGEKHK